MRVFPVVLYSELGDRRVLIINTSPGVTAPECIR